MKKLFVFCILIILIFPQLSQAGSPAKINKQPDTNNRADYQSTSFIFEWEYDKRDATSSDYFWWIWQVWNIPTCDKETWEIYQGIAEYINVASVSLTRTYEQVVSSQFNFFNYVDTRFLPFTDNDIRYFKDDGIYCYNIHFAQFQNYPSIYDGIHITSLDYFMIITNDDSYPDEKGDSGFGSLGYSNPLFIFLGFIAVIFIRRNFKI